MMPEMSGLHVVERVAELCPGVKILHISGYTGNALIQHGLTRASVNQNGISFFAKPFTTDALARKVREILDAAGGRKALQ
jgi:two-component SAPR family response regulator